MKMNRRQFLGGLLGAVASAVLPKADCVADRNWPLRWDEPLPEWYIKEQLERDPENQPHQWWTVGVDDGSPDGDETVAMVFDVVDDGAMTLDEYLRLDSTVEKAVGDVVRDVKYASWDVKPELTKAQKMQAWLDYCLDNYSGCMTKPRIVHPNPVANWLVARIEDVKHGWIQ